MGSRRVINTVTMTLLAVTSLVVLSPDQVQAAGEQYGANGYDLQLSVDYRWAGGSFGGYYPVRIGLQNRGPSRELEVAFRPMYGAGGLPVTSRRISIDQNASASFTLLIPLAGQGNYGTLSVTHNGRELKNLQNNITLPDTSYQPARPALLAISPTPVGMQALEDALTSLTMAGHPTHSRSHGYGSVSSDNQSVEPFRLPETWLAYSGVDVVFIALKDFEGLPETQRAAIVQWVRTGGTLLVHSVGEPVSGSRRLATLTGIDQQSQPVNWRAADSARRTVIPVRKVDEYGNVVEKAVAVPEQPLEPDEARDRSVADPDRLSAFAWSVEQPPFEIGELGQGQLIGFIEDPFSGTVQDWGWLLRSVPLSRMQQTDRLGVAGRLGNQEFLEFLISSVRSVPIMAFLIFISVFTFVIGPLNYFILARKKKLNFLVLTIPAIAIVTSLLLFSYSMLAHGFSVKSRIRSLTIIDQGNRQAVSTARLALYAGITPSDGLSFSPSTAVIPIRAKGDAFESASTDWTDTQWLRSGWLRSRTRTQFLTINVRPERGRLTVSDPTETELPVSNGLEWPLEAVLVTDRDGKLWFASDLAAGSRKALKPMTGEDKTSFVKRLDRSAPGIPAELEDRRGVDSLNWTGYRRDWYAGQFRVSNGQMERTIAEIRRQIQRDDVLAPNRYYAIVREAPAVEFGTEVDVVDAWHLLIGYY